MKDDVIIIWLELQQHNLGLKGMLYLTGGNDMTPYDHKTLNRARQHQHSRQQSNLFLSCLIANPKIRFQNYK